MLMAPHCPDIPAARAARIGTPLPPRVRPIRRTDGAAILRMHERCSQATRHARWLGPGSSFPASYLRSMLDGGDEHLAVVATCPGRPGEVVGLGSAAHTPDGSWELGLLVEDRYQRNGIGTLLLGRLVQLVGPEAPLCASALSANGRLLGKLARFGAVSLEHDSGVSYARVVRSRS
ncbi:hypothetical protein A5714_23915 [Mycobacterium sp. E2462]|uniref:GNAT family N-acetyltransferase n=1 Tax=unclassified Mycobacterium TaxID=2642494 RepID=UPI0008018ACC|nr:MULTISPECIES: GNAT family N-acetyltransferase [unclassified Mycobacterium]OBG75624.1 hypothetical protein A5700_24270 [Mycobacterium sp. E1214]OBH23653.1 hypothetical protein A5693_10150 [Mycobacterium sp. E1319]OBI05928.1 hypothetical protein A5714_23915 [Mycobacterium sp. E2462]